MKTNEDSNLLKPVEQRWVDGLKLISPSNLSSAAKFALVQLGFHPKREDKGGGSPLASPAPLSFPGLSPPFSCPCLTSRKES